MKKSPVQASAGPTSSQASARIELIAYRLVGYLACSISVQTSCIFLSSAASGAG